MPFEMNHDVRVGKDDEGHVRQLSHPLRPFAWSAVSGVESTASARGLADQYLREIQGVINLPQEATADLSSSFEGVPSEAAMDLRFKDEKRLADAAAVTYSQARFGIPVWNAGVTVRVSMAPLAVTGATNLVHYDLDLPRPSDRAPYLPDKLHEAELAQLFPPGVLTGHKINLADPKTKPTRLWIYRFDPDQRLDPEARPRPPGVAFEQGPPTLPLLRVPASIRPRQHYVVTEVLFSMPLVDWGNLNWRALVEVETGTILYLRALTACVGKGSVFISDPVTLDGAGHSAQEPAAKLDALRSDVDLTASAPAAPHAKVALKGDRVELVDRQSPSTVAPTEAEPFKFIYSAKTPSFAAVSAYHHCDAIFRMIEDMGIPLSDYFDGTQFPVPVDFDALGGAVNAQAPGNATGNGSGGFLFGTAAPGTGVGIATDVRVVLHEFGHALLWDHVSSPNFGFAHSPGDSLAAILHDPGSKAPDPFETFPFMAASAGLSRRHDRDVSQGWAWGGPWTHDDRQYGSEQILSTTLFRVYQACGGNDADLAVRRFASQYIAYLIIKGVGLLSFMTTDPRVYADALMESDITTVSFKGHPGGAFHKVIRWSFEKQGLYQPPGAPRPVTKPGAPPEIDVYIDDEDDLGNARKGEYMPYPSRLGATADVWNRNVADGGHDHQAPRAGVQQFLYVKVRNRGTAAASRMVVTAFQSSANHHVWPAGWTPLAAPLQVTGSLPPGGQIVVGPFAWNPASDQPQVLASVSAPGDLSNAELIQRDLELRRLVTTDNNIAVRAM